MRLQHSHSFIQVRGYCVHIHNLTHTSGFEQISQIPILFMKLWWTNAVGFIHSLWQHCYFNNYYHAIILTFVNVSIVYGAKYQYTGPGRSCFSFSAGEFLCKRHFWQSQWPKGGFILMEGWFADRGPDSFHPRSGISDIRHRTKGLQKHIRDVETYSRCLESRAPDHILEDIWPYTKVGKNNVTRRQSTSLLTPVTAKH